MGNFASSALCVSGSGVAIDNNSTFADIPHDKVRSTVAAVAAVAAAPRRVVAAIKAAFAGVYRDMVASLSGSSVVTSQLDETWYLDLLVEVDARRARCQRAAAHSDEVSSTVFLGPADTIVAPISSLSFLAARTTRKPWSKSASNEDDDTSSCKTGDETDDESKCDYSDCDVSDCDVSDCDGSEYGSDHERALPLEEVEYYSEDDDTETKADHLLRLASLSSVNDDAPLVYVEDYLCPCGECPQYERIACDVRATVTWRGPKEQASITRVLQAFSTYNEVIGYHADMIEAAEECLQLWLGDEDRALHSFVMLYDEVPQLCAAGGKL